MKAINGKLDMSKSYTLVSVEYGELNEGSAELCENCGKVISNIAVVKSSDDKTFRIGLDCMMTLTNMIPSDKLQAKNTIALKRRFLKVLRTEAQYIEFCTSTKNPNVHTFWMYSKAPIENESARGMLGRGDYDQYKNAIQALNLPVKCIDKITV